VTFMQLIFLLGSLAVAGPIIAHLLAKPRYKRIAFTMLRFLQAGQKESQSRRRFRDLLILLLRCCIIVLIAMLFARPRLFVTRNVERSEHAYYMGLDNSLSMSYADSGGSYFDKMIRAATDYVNAADADAVFNICALATGSWKKDLTKELALYHMKSLKISARSADINEFLSALKAAELEKSRDGKTSVFLSSDFTPQAIGQFFTDDSVFAGEVEIKTVATDEPVNNAAISAVTVAGAGGRVTADVVLANYGQEAQKRKLAVRTPDTQLHSVEIELDGNRQKTVTVPLEIESLENEDEYLPLTFELSGDDGLEADDRFCVTISMPEMKSVNLLIADSGAGETFLPRVAIQRLAEMESAGVLAIRQANYDDLVNSDFDWANVIICSAIDEKLGKLSSDLKNFTAAGGKLILFANEGLSGRAAQYLWADGLLAAMPDKLVEGPHYLNARSDDDPDVTAFDSRSLRSLHNYRVKSILFKLVFECQQHPESSCLWRFGNGMGFLYCKRAGSGTAIFINTSADDSLSTLTKSGASLAFFGYLLSRGLQIQQTSFTPDQRVLLPASEMERESAGDKKLWVEACDGSKVPAALSDSFLALADAGGVGWVRTLGKPIRYAGVNPEPGETDMTKPDARRVAAMSERVFTVAEEKGTADIRLLEEKEYKPLWRAVAWLLIGLLVLEPAVANRMKR
jgi:hypothetical protein